MTLKTFLDKYPEFAKELIRCRSCLNILLHSGRKYEIVKIGSAKEEEILCETCKKNKRNIEFVTRISSSSEDNNHVFQVPISISQLEISTTNIKEEKEKELEKV
jgi:hypothetical protein